jgi:hypothetical protein
MSRSTGSRGGGGVAAVILLFVALLLPVLYVLSTGPVVWYCMRNGYGEHFVDTFYAPLIWLCEAIPAFGNLVEQYVQWWVGDLP